MPKYKVLVTREVSESAEVFVEAASEDEANEKATEIADSLDSGLNWEQDEAGYRSESHATNCEKIN